MNLSHNHEPKSNTEDIVPKKKKKTNPQKTPPPQKKQKNNTKNPHPQLNYNKHYVIFFNNMVKIMERHKISIEHKLLAGSVRTLNIKSRNSIIGIQRIRLSLKR